MNIRINEELELQAQISEKMGELLFLYKKLMNGYPIPKRMGYTLEDKYHLKMWIEKKENYEN